MKTLPIILVLAVVVFFVFITKGATTRGSCPPGYYSRPGSTWAGWTFDCLPIGESAM